MEPAASRGPLRCMEPVGASTLQPRREARGVCVPMYQIKADVVKLLIPEYLSMACTDEGSRTGVLKERKVSVLQWHAQVL